MRKSRCVGVTTAACLVAALACLTAPGCGDNAAVSEVQVEKPPTESLKDSMDYMRSKHAKKASSAKR